MIRKILMHSSTAFRGRGARLARLADGSQFPYMDPGATLDDLREAVATLEDTERSARRVFGTAHPITEGAACYLKESRAALRARETTGRA